MCTEKQKAANAANAQRSTGPRSAGGKAKSSRNSLKHGMTVGVPCGTPDLDAKQAADIDEWEEHSRPEGPEERALVRRAAVANWRLELCEKRERAEIKHRQRAATARWLERERRQAAELAKALQADPGATVEQLQGSSAGCAWMIDAWLKLKHALEANGRWSDSEQVDATRLCGRHAWATFEGDKLLHDLRVWAVSLWPERTPEEKTVRLGATTKGRTTEHLANLMAKVLYPPAQAYARLTAFVKSELARLDALAAELVAGVEREIIEEVHDRALQSGSPQAARILRYESAADSTMLRSMRAFHQLERAKQAPAGGKERAPSKPDAMASEADIVTVASEPAGKPEPTSEPEPEPEPTREQSPAAAPPPEEPVQLRLVEPETDSASETPAQAAQVECSSPEPAAAPAPAPSEGPTEPAQNEPIFSEASAAQTSTSVEPSQAHAEPPPAANPDEAYLDQQTRTQGGWNTDPPRSL